MAVSAKVKKYIDQLMKGLEQYGKYYNISNKRFYSERMGRYCMKYILEDVQDRSFRIETYNKTEILKYLVREWCEVTGSPVPEACLEELEENKKTKVLDSFKKYRPKFENGYKK